MSDPWEESLMRHERFLLRLAARLAGTEAEAEDLVQDTFVRALERPPRARGADEPGPLRAWLATVLRRQAGRSARGARRRAAREERVARPDATGSAEAAEGAASVDARLDAHAELLALLRDLPEGERQALFLRYSEDLDVEAIAARVEAPLETVRTRLRRGRERLRARLDARHGDRATWIALLLPASALRPPLLPTGAAEAAGPALVASTIGTGVIVGTTTKVLAGAALCAAALYVLVGRGGEPDPRSAAVAPDANPTRDVELVADGALESAGAEAGRESAPAAQAPAPIEVVWPPREQPAPLPAAAPWPLVVRAVGVGAEGARISVKARLDAFGRYDPRPLEGTLDAASELRVDVGPHLADVLAHADGARAEELIVRLDHPDLMPAEASLLLPDPLDPTVAPDAPLVVLVRVERASIVIGRVVDDAHEPLAGETFVQAHARRGDALEPEPRGSTEPAEDGTFRLRVDGEGPFALLAVGVRLRPGTALPVLARGGVVDVGDVGVSRGLSIDGRAVDLSGAPHKGASVFAMLLGARSLIDLDRFSFELPGTVAWHEGAFELFANEAKCAADGAFRIEGLGPRRYVLDTLAPGVDVPFVLPGKQEVIAPATVELRPQAAELRLAFVFPDGARRDGKGVWTRGEEEKSFDLPGWVLGLDQEAMAASFDVGAASNDYEVSNVAGSDADGLVLFEVPDSMAGKPFVRRFALPPHEPFGLALRFDGCRPVELAFDTPGVGQVLEREVRLAPDLAAARVILVLRGVPVDDGMPFRAVVREADGERDRDLKVAGGKLVLDDLGPGTVAIELTLGEDRFAPQAHVCSVNLELDLAPGEERVLEVELALGGSLILEARNEEGARLEAGCTVRNAAGDALDVIFVARIPNGRAAAHNHLFSGGPSRGVPELPPGRYTVEVRSPGYRTEEIDLTIEAGATAERSIVLRGTD